MDASIVADQLTWYVARASGLLSWALLGAGVVLGLTLSSKANVAGRRPRPVWTLDLHRFLGGLATVFVAVHVAALVADSYVSFGPTDILVPLASNWRPVAVAWGVVGMYLLVAVEATSLLRKHLPRRLWKVTHMASFPLYGVATLHALTAGTDTGGVFRWVALATTMLVGALTGLRVAQATTRPARPQATNWMPVPMPPVEVGR